jgi:hypothetical protein
VVLPESFGVLKDLIDGFVSQSLQVGCEVIADTGALAIEADLQLLVFQGSLLLAAWMNALKIASATDAVSAVLLRHPYKVKEVLLVPCSPAFIE